MSGQILDGGSGRFQSSETLLYPRGLVARLVDVLFDASPQLRGMLQPRGLRREHGFCLLLHRVGVPQPLGQSLLVRHLNTPDHAPGERTHPALYLLVG